MNKTRNLVVMRSLNATPLAPLQGTENDALHLSRYCLSSNFIGKADLFWLKDNQATRKGFLDLMLETVIPITYETEGGTLISLFSGHGARDRYMRDTDETDGLTEFQVPYDYRQKGYWADTELAALYGLVNPSWGVRLWNDCCHSGNSLRALGSFFGFSTRKALPAYCRSTKTVALTFDYLQHPRAVISEATLRTCRSRLWASSAREARANAARQLWQYYQADYFQRIYEHENIIAAQGCRAEQSSMDAVVADIPQGAFSAALWASAATLPVGASWSAVVQQATRWLKDNGFQEQDPLLEASAPFLLDEPFFT